MQWQNRFPLIIKNGKISPKISFHFQVLDALWVYDSHLVQFFTGSNTSTDLKLKTGKNSQPIWLMASLTSRETSWQIYLSYIGNTHGPFYAMNYYPFIQKSKYFSLTNHNYSTSAFIYISQHKVNLVLNDITI